CCALIGQGKPCPYANLSVLCGKILLFQLLLFSSAFHVSDEFIYSFFVVVIQTFKFYSHSCPGMPGAFSRGTGRGPDDHSMRLDGLIMVTGEIKFYLNYCSYRGRPVGFDKDTPFIQVLAETGKNIHWS
ncbi:MAG: hypothetical protein Q8O60_06945, partial [Deltaproteobacteria bacterium]|nr:hypothetical protein [Deltaproteobacteria bacterium]